MDTQDEGASSSSLRTERLERRELSPTSGEPAHKRHRTSQDTQDSQIVLGLSDHPEHTPPAATNSRIFAGRIEDSQNVYNLKIIFPQHTEDSFGKQARDQRSAVIPTHRLLARGSALFKHIEDLGRGDFGIVDKVDPTGEQYLPGKVYARKVITLGRRRDGGGVLNELAQLDMARSLHHPHIVTIIMTYEEEVGFHRLQYGIIMSPVANCTLRLFLERASSSDVPNRQLPKAVQKWFGCLASALSYLHANDILHRRIKPSSIVVKDGDVFFTEFAVSNHFEGTYVLVKEASNTIGSCDVYRAPEIEMQQQFGPKADIFSLGCVYVEMLTAAAGISLAKLNESFGEEPFSPYSRHLTRTMEWLAEVQGRLPSDFPKGFIECCQSMLQHDPGARLSAFEVTKFIFKSNSKFLEGSGMKLECDCLLPWQGNKEESCKLLM